ncbi:hypothetical protein [Janthinobacterium sp. MDB2-8]|uniref:hypothetical protein n=1 Tax=Janthinobacterium sp. MDB2-8 TaxID=1259338 RepID=UPI003F1F27AE
MTNYQKWMASSHHLKVFKAVANCGFFLTLMLCLLLFTGPWSWWSRTHNYSTDIFGTGVVILTSLGFFVFVATIRYFPVPAGDIWIAVGIKKDVLALHMWKAFPSRNELCEVAAKAVQLGLELRCKTVRIESPLLVRDGRLQMWGDELRTCLTSFGSQVVIQVIPPKDMFFLSAGLFSLHRKIMRYDLKKKHLPAMQGLFKCQTAGFIIQLPC